LKHLLHIVRTSLAARISSIIVLMIFVVMTLIGVVCYSMYRSDAIHANGQRALAIAYSVSAAIDGDEFQQIMQTREKTTHWYLAKEIADKAARSTDISYLYVLDRHTTDVATYFLEGFDSTSEEEEFDLGTEEDISLYPQEMLYTIETGLATISAIYSAGDYGPMLTTCVPVQDSEGIVQGVVCVDISMTAMMKGVSRFGLQLLIVSLVTGILFAVLCVFLIHRLVGRPIAKLTAASDHIAGDGETNIVLDITRHDEIGRLADSFSRLIDSERHQALTLEALASGDLTVRARPRGENDTTGNAINSLAEQLNIMVAEISNSAGQVSITSGAIAQGALSLSSGAVEQNATIDQLAEFIRNISEEVNENNRRVNEAVALSHTVIELAETEQEQMRQMTAAVHEIEKANRTISDVMHIIDEIARQTNLLALNASIEASHAGRQGAGFAVVAGEVRRLAVRCAESSQMTEQMVESSIEKTSLGVRITKNTAESMENIIREVRNSNNIILGIADSSKKQGATLRSIQKNVEAVASIVQQNSLTAQQSASASEKMNGQADVLNSLMVRFHL